MEPNAACNEMSTKLVEIRYRMTVSQMSSFKRNYIQHSYTNLNMIRWSQIADRPTFISICLFISVPFICMWLFKLRSNIQTASQIPSKIASDLVEMMKGISSSYSSFLFIWCRCSLLFMSKHPNVFIYALITFSWKSCKTNINFCSVVVWYLNRNQSYRMDLTKVFRELNRFINLKCSRWMARATNVHHS